MKTIFEKWWCNNTKVISLVSYRKDWKNEKEYNLVKSGVISLKELNDYENSLTINSSDKCKGKRFNRLCNNQWCRGRLTNIITKLCNLYKINLQKVIANYSSFIGNLVYRNERLPDYGT